MRRPRKLTVERADAINRKRDLVEGTERHWESDPLRVHPGRLGTDRASTVDAARRARDAT